MTTFIATTSAALSNSVPSQNSPSISTTKRRLSVAAASLFRHPLLLLSSAASSHKSSHQQKCEEERRYVVYKTRLYRPDKMPPQIEMNQSKSTSKTIHRYTLHKEIGCGRYGKVYLATDNSVDEGVNLTRPLALKVMEKRDAFLDELEHLTNFKRHTDANEYSSPFLVHLVAYCELRYTAPDKEVSRYLLATRLAEGGSLRNLMRIQLKGILRLTEAEAAFYLLELTEALTHLHSLGIIHQDIKPDNVLLTADGHIMLADFGLATLTERPYSEYRGNIVCKSNHMPPEVHRNESAGRAETMNHSVDWFSLGVLVFRLVAASYPPTHRHSAEEWKLAFKKFNCSRPLSHLLQRLMERDFKLRLGSTSLDGEEIFEHTFVRRVLPSVLLCPKDEVFGQQSIKNLREIICDKRLRPVFKPHAIQLLD